MSARLINTLEAIGKPAKLQECLDGGRVLIPHRRTKSRSRILYPRAFDEVLAQGIDRERLLQF